MLKTKIEKIRNKLLIKREKSNLIYNYFKKSFLALSEWYLYPELRKKNIILSLFKINRLPLFLTTLFIIWTITLFSFGKISTIKKVRELENQLTQMSSELDSSSRLISYKESIIDRIRTQVGSRQYLEYIIKRDCHLRNPDNLSKLSDEVFFTMIDEIEKNKIPYTVFFRVIDFESGFTYATNSTSGAFGYCQLLPSTFTIGAKHLKLKENSEVNNVKIGAWVLKYGFDRWKAKGLSDKEAWFRSLVDYSGGSHALAEKEMMYFKENLFKAKEELKNI